MKNSHLYRVFALAALALAAPVMPASAQITTNWSFVITPPTNPAAINNTLTYTLNLTNFTGFRFVASNSLSGPAQLTSATATPGVGIVSNSITSVSFVADPALAGQIAQMVVTAQATDAGFISNTIVLSDISTGTNLSTNIVITQITSAPLAQTDLAIGVTSPIQSVIVNDYMTFGVSVTNLGPNAANNVEVLSWVGNQGTVTNVTLRAISPASQSHNITNGFLQLPLGTVATQAVRNLQITVQPTNAGSLTVLVGVDSPGTTDSNTNNNVASFTINVTNYFSSNLVATALSAPSFNPQSGLMEQSIQLSNASPTPVNSARVVVSGQTNWLYNAFGTNDGNPFVVHGATLPSGQTVNLWLQYLAKSHQAFGVSLQAFEIPRYDLTPHIPLNTPVNFAQTPIHLSSGYVFIDFPSTPGRTYTVVYSDTAGSNQFAAQPPVTANANFTEWIDYGPPATVSAQTNTDSRFYRVYRNP